MQSKNQPLKISIRSKCNILKREVRRRDLNDYFKVKRQQLQLLNQKQYLNLNFRQICHQINHLNQNFLQLKNIEIKIINFINQNPEENYKWILIGNFMLSVSQNIQNFQLYILNNNQINNSNHLYLWCLGVYINLFFETIQLNYQQLTSLDFQKLQRIDLFLSQLFEDRMKTTVFNESNLKQFSIMLLYINILLDENQNAQCFPFKTIKTLLSQLYNFYQSIQNQKKVQASEIKLKISKILLQIIDQMKKKSLFDQVYDWKVTNQNQLKINKLTIENMLKSAGIIFQDNINSVSEYRTQCLQKILLLSSNFPIETSQYLLDQKIINELVYLMINLNHKTGQIVLKIFYNLLQAMSNKNFQILINASFDINLTQILYNTLAESSKNSMNSELIFYILKNIQLLFDKLNLFSERAFRTVLNRMESKNIHLLFQKLTQNRNEERIEQVLSNIFDNYYSEQCEFQDEENSMRYCNSASDNPKFKNDLKQQKSSSFKSQRQEFQI